MACPEKVRSWHNRLRSRTGDLQNNLLSKPTRNRYHPAARQKSCGPGVSMPDPLTCIAPVNALVLGAPNIGMRRPCCPLASALNKCVIVRHSFCALACRRKSRSIGTRAQTQALSMRTQTRAQLKRVRPILSTQSTKHLGLPASSNPGSQCSSAQAFGRPQAQNARQRGQLPHVGYFT